MIRRAGMAVKIVAAALAFTATALAVTKTDAANQYTATDQTTYSFVAAGAGATSVLGNSDDGTVLLTLPFPFVFYGRTYTSVCASANGALWLGLDTAGCAAMAAVDFVNGDLAAGAPNDAAAILPLWTDLDFSVPGAGSVLYQTIGEAPNRTFLLQWSNAYVSNPETRVAFPVTLEVVLSEGSNQILMQYLKMDSATPDAAAYGGLATVGIRDTGGTPANGRFLQWSCRAGVIANRTALAFTPPAGSATGTYTITSNPVGLQVVIDGAPHLTPKVMSWPVGSVHTVSAPSPQTVGGIRSTFTSWSQGSGTITAQASGGTYTASFNTEYQLRTTSNPAGGGTVAGAGWYPPETVVPVLATPAANYAFVGFSGDVSGSANPVNVQMKSPRIVAGNFRTAGNPVLRASVTARSTLVDLQRIWTILLTNSGLAPAVAPQITGLTLTQTLGTPCTPVLKSIQQPAGDIPPSGSKTGKATIDFAGCGATVRFAVRIDFSANGGAYTGYTTLANQTR